MAKHAQDRKGTHTLSAETKDMQSWNVCRLNSAEEPEAAAAAAAAVVWGSGSLSSAACEHSCILGRLHF